MSFPPTFSKYKYNSQVVFIEEWAIMNGKITENVHPKRVVVKPKG